METLELYLAKLSVNINNEFVYKFVFIRTGLTIWRNRCVAEGYGVRMLSYSTCKFRQSYKQKWQGGRDMYLPHNLKK
jgi:hypothetical protein